MEIVIKALQLILALSLLVFVHELGHYLSARWFGIRVEKFYIFMDVGGVSLFKFKIGETTFGIGWLPFGGYCKISGMIDESLDTEAMKAPPQPWEFRSKPAWQRLIVMVGGVVMNVVAACVIYIGMSWHWGESYIDNGDLTWGYAFNELGHEAGFRDGDRIVSLDGEAVSGDFGRVYVDMVIGGVRSVGVLREGEGVPEGAQGDIGGTREATVTIPEELIARMLESTDFMTPRIPFVVTAVPAETDTRLAAGDSLVALNGVPMAFRHEYERALAEIAGTTAAVTVVRDSAGVAVRRTVEAPVSADGRFGVNARIGTDYFPVHTRDYSFAEAVPAGFRRAGSQISGYWDQLKLVVSPQTGAYKQVGSLITIGSIFPGTWNWLVFWSVTAFISIALAVINILPIPALDGGHTLFLLWEVVTRRRLSDKFLEWATTVGMVLLMALIVFTFWNDIYRFFIK
ncbi:MAG: RIP metalloprotease RseP [Alistipes sp.]|jgi:regulator of sigma E protease|nr:RIP metalloprotease RseP [Alistipes sp.]